VDSKTEVMCCGCVREFVNNKWITIQECSEHDPDNEPRQQKPFIKKFRKAVQDYI